MTLEMSVQNKPHSLDELFLDNKDMTRIVISGKPGYQFTLTTLVEFAVRFRCQNGPLGGIPETAKDVNVSSSICLLSTVVRGCPSIA